MALGHLHGAQRVGQEKIRYCGTLLKYSVSEASQKKTLHVVELKEKGSEPEIQKLPLHPLRDVTKTAGELWKRFLKRRMEPGVKIMSV